MQRDLESALMHRRNQKVSVVSWLDTHREFSMQVNLMSGKDHVCVTVNKSAAQPLSVALLTALDMQIEDMSKKLR